VSDARGRYGLYIHVPFCSSICSYCHFARTDRHDSGLRRRYAEALVREYELRSEACPALGSGHRRLATCYLGGGTPSLLEPENLRRVLAGTLGRSETVDDPEVTAEANPESLTAELATVWREAGINRVSLGVQSLDDHVLRLLGRDCDAATTARGLELACARFDRVAADWILGPGVELASLCDQLDRAVDLGVEHFSLYLLEVHRGTALQQDLAAGKLAMPRDAKFEHLYLGAVRHLAKRGVRQYEVANFARPGAESRHNSAYWRGVPYLGLGPGAHGFSGRGRYANPGAVEAWLAPLEGGRLPDGPVDPLDLQARRLERVILGLRTTQGVPLAWLPAGFDPEPERADRLWDVREGRLVLTSRGFLRIDTIEEFLA